MALFGKKQNEVLEIELFTEEPNERVFEFKKSKTVVRIDNYFIRIARKTNMSNVFVSPSTDVLNNTGNFLNFKIFSSKNSLVFWLVIVSK